MRRDLRILDADAHVVEPGPVFEAFIEPGDPVFDLPASTPRVPCGDWAVIEDQASHGFDAPSYLRAMDAQGIDGAVLFPSIGLFVPFSPRLSVTESAAACRSYNEWVASYCATDASRLAAVGLVPQRDPKLAAAEARHAAELGLVGVIVRPNHLYDTYLGDPAFDPFYDVVEETGVVLAVHEALGVDGPTIGSDRFTTFAERHACSHPLEQMAAMTGLVLGGVLERHPELRVAFLESGTGWMPYWLNRLDNHHEWMEHTELAGLSLTPSEYFARQCVTCSDPEDGLAPWVIARLGADHVMWASDFPHPDALFPDAVDHFLDDMQSAVVDREPLSAVLWETPARFYGLAERFRG